MTLTGTNGRDEVEATVASALRRVNGEWHRRALFVFLVIVWAHWTEHLLQAFQMYALGWTPQRAGGGLGLLFPSLATSELLHYGYNFALLCGLALLLPGFRGESRSWWTAALAIQFWHHFEHALLLGQAMLGKNLLGAEVPTSVLQFFFRRAELHQFYNGIVLIPLLVGFYLHRRRRSLEGEEGPECSCADALDVGPPPVFRSRALSDVAWMAAGPRKRNGRGRDEDAGVRRASSKCRASSPTLLCPRVGTRHRASDGNGEEGRSK